MKKPKKVRPARISKRAYYKLIKYIKSENKLLYNLIKSQVIPVLTSRSRDKAEVINKSLDNILEILTERLEMNARGYIEFIVAEVVKKVNISYSNAGFSLYHSSEDTLSIIKASVESHLALIKTIPQHTIQQSRTVLLQSIGAFDANTLSKQLRELTLQSDRKVELIARDQTAKTLEAYSRAEAKDLGFQYYVWITSKDARVSTGDGGHKYLHDRIYKYDTPTAIVDSNGTKGHPSWRPNCRCTSIPLDSDDIILKLKKDPKRGDYYVIQR